jgi:ribulose 1,5-bisphosphate synthetase/thiazole synthase
LLNISNSANLYKQIAPSSGKIVNKEVEMSINQDFVIEPQRKIPVYKKVDVVIAGGGPAGFAATVAAARNGADTLLVERNPFLGGQASASYVWLGGHDFLTGICKEVAERLDDLRAGRLLERYRRQTAATGIKPVPYHMPFDIETYKFISSDMVEESGAKMLTRTMAVDAIVENRKVKGIIIENKSGRQAVLADVVIDASGDADIAARAGVPMDKEPESGPLPMVMLFRIGGVNYKKIAAYAREHPKDFNPGTGVPPGEFEGDNTASITGMGGWRSLVAEAKEKGELPKEFRRDFTLQTSPINVEHGIAHVHAVNVLHRWSYDAEDFHEAELEGRKAVRQLVQFIKKLPGLEDSFLIDVANTIGRRDSRRIIGEYVLTREDIYASRTFDDDIAYITHVERAAEAQNTERSGWLVHSKDGRENSLEHQKEMKTASYHHTISGIPYRCLLPKGVEGLLVAGHTISMTYMAHGSGGPSRGMPACMAYGQAAGTAAAIAIKQGISVKKVDIPTLRKTLESQGVDIRQEVIDLSEVQREYALRDNPPREPYDLLDKMVG